MLQNSLAIKLDEIFEDRRNNNYEENFSNICVNYVMIFEHKPFENHDIIYTNIWAFLRLVGFPSVSYFFQYNYVISLSM